MITLDPSYLVKCMDSRLTQRKAIPSSQEEEGEERHSLIVRTCDLNQLCSQQQVQGFIQDFFLGRGGGGAHTFV